MILNFLKEISLETLRKNIEINLENYKSATNDWIFKFFDDNSPFSNLKRKFLNLIWTCLLKDLKELIWKI